MQPLKPGAGLPMVRQGDPISAAGESAVRHRVNELGRIQGPAPKRYHRIKVMRLSEVIGTQQSDDSDAWHDRTAVAQYFNSLTHEFEDANATYTTITDPFNGLPADVDDRIPCYYSEQAGRWIPLFARTVRHAITCRADGVYPPEVSVIPVAPGTGDYGSDILARMPNVYPIKFIRIDYSETPTSHGYAAPTITYLNPTNVHDDFVFNIADQQGEYLPFGTVVSVYHVAGQWFCDPSNDPPVIESSSSIEESDQVGDGLTLVEFHCLSGQTFSPPTNPGAEVHYGLEVSIDGGNTWAAIHGRVFVVNANVLWNQELLEPGRVSSSGVYTFHTTENPPATSDGVPADSESSGGIPGILFRLAVKNYARIATLVHAQVRFVVASKSISAAPVDFGTQDEVQVNGDSLTPWHIACAANNNGMFSFSGENIIFQGIPGQVYSVSATVGITLSIGPDETESDAGGESSSGGGECVSSINGVRLSDLPVGDGTDVAYTLYVATDGCLKVLDTGDCDEV